MRCDMVEAHAWTKVADRTLHTRHQECHNRLALLAVHRRLWIRDHKEDEELIHRASDRSDLLLNTNQQRGCVITQQCPQGRKEEEEQHVRARNVEAVQAIDNHASEQPDDHHRQHVVAPLNRQRCHRLRSDKQKCSNGEVGWIPEVPSMQADDVFTQDCDTRSDQIRPPLR